MRSRAPQVVVMGVAGAGKSTVARLLAERLGVESADADDFHSPANVAKMAAGEPLDEDDRAPWLRAVSTWLHEQSLTGHSAVIACSSLRRAHRDVLRDAAGDVWFLHLHGAPELLSRRLRLRSGHFMPPELLGSQLAALEPLGRDEDGMSVDVSAEPAVLAERAARALRLREAAARTD